jgi:membrane protease YdiL (CAAX protease family)
MVYSTIILAHFFWFITFYIPFGLFWLKIGISVALLATISLLADRNLGNRFRIDKKSVLAGIIFASILYFIFWAGKEISSVVFPFAKAQIHMIYDKGGSTPSWLIFLLLLSITGPGEEIYWRGFIQEKLMSRFGLRNGYVLAVALYASVHIWSFNFILIGAAAVAGIFWGAIYLYTRNLVPLIICHSLWSAFIFAVYPLN